MCTMNLPQLKEAIKCKAVVLEVEGVFLLRLTSRSSGRRCARVWVGSTTASASNILLWFEGTHRC